MLVFISYSSKDVEFAIRLRDQIRAWGHQTWRDHDDIPKGGLWYDEIPAALQRADAVVAIFSPNSMASNPCKNEWVDAIKNNKVFCPILIQPTEINPFFRNFQYTNFVKDEREGFRQLKSALERPHEPTPPPTLSLVAEFPHTRHYLTWIAKGLLKHNQDIFHPAVLQPKWLEQKRQVNLYQAITVIVVVFTAVAISSGYLVIYGLTIQIALQTSINFDEWMTIGIFLSFAIALIYALGYAPIIASKISLNEGLDWSWSGKENGSHINLTWRFMYSFIITGIVYVIARFAYPQVYPIFTALISCIYGISIWLAFELGAGFFIKEIPSDTKPYQRLAWSITTSGVYFFLAAISVGVSFTLAFGLSRNVIAGIGFGVISGIGYGLLHSFFHGGANVNRYIALRIALYITGDAPLNYKRFLDAVKVCGLMVQNEDGYRFNPDSLKEFFAKLD